MLILKKIGPESHSLLFEVMVGASFNELVLEGVLWKVPEFIDLIFLGVAVDDVVWLLLSFVHSESFKALLPLGYVFGLRSIGHVS